MDIKHRARRAMFRFLLGLALLPFVCASPLNISRSALTNTTRFFNPHPPNGTTVPLGQNRSFTVDLDAKPEERWQHVAGQFTKALQPIVDFFNDQVPKWLRPTVEKFFAEVETFLAEPYKSELQGISKATNIPLGLITLSNIFYEINSGCTSIVASANGTVVHGRNLDYGVPGLRGVTVNIDFIRSQTSGKEVLFRAATYAGYIGVLTGVKPGAFSVSLDQRDTTTEMWALLKNTMEAVFEHGSILGVMIRETLDTAKDFETALVDLQEKHTISTAYLIVGGVEEGEGAVITRDRNDPRDVWYMDSNANRWFLVETNYDHWEQVPTSDDRRGPANTAMTALSPQTLTVDKMTKVMNTFPMLNSHTTYTTIMRASDGYLQTSTQNVQ